MTYNVFGGTLSLTQSIIAIVLKLLCLTALFKGYLKTYLFYFVYN